VAHVICVLTQGCVSETLSSPEKKEKRRGIGRPASSRPYNVH
jgi:hypothetical protein